MTPKQLGAITRDLAGLVGAVLTAYGFWLIYPPLGFIVGGGLLLGGAILVARAATGE